MSPKRNMTQCSTRSLQHTRHEPQQAAPALVLSCFASRLAGHRPDRRRQQTAGPRKRTGGINVLELLTLGGSRVVTTLDQGHKLEHPGEPTR